MADKEVVEDSLEETVVVRSFLDGLRKATLSEWRITISQLGIATVFSLILLILFWRVSDRFLTSHERFVSSIAQTNDERSKTLFEIAKTQDKYYTLMQLINENQTQILRNQELVFNILKIQAEVERATLKAAEKDGS